MDMPENSRKEYRKKQIDADANVKSKEKNKWKVGENRVDEIRKVSNKYFVLDSLPEDNDQELIMLRERMIVDKYLNEKVQPTLQESILWSKYMIKLLVTDGFTAAFFKKAWKVIGNDFCKAVKEFFRSGRMLGEINATLISLIPKVDTPNKQPMLLFIPLKEYSRTNILAYSGVNGLRIHRESGGPLKRVAIKMVTKRLMSHQGVWIRKLYFLTISGILESTLMQLRMAFALAEGGWVYFGGVRSWHSNAPSSLSLDPNNEDEAVVWC
ncbi:hypothetical protein Tco_0488349 [Tanacetum coccineum]